MSKYWRLLGEYNAESKTYSACAGGSQTSPYTPDEDAKLIGLRVICSADAATTLIESVQFKLTCTKFKPNSIEVMGRGNGLLTVPTNERGPIIDYVVEQDVKAGVPITVEARNLTADTPVGVLVHLMGCFES